MYLKIENLGVCPIEGFTMFGATTKRKASFDNPLIVGTFGSGAKHAVGVLLRASMTPKIYCDLVSLEFFTKNIFVGESQHSQVCCKMAGKDPNGKQLNRTIDMSFTLDYGNSDWQEISMAMREFISNAIDGQIESTGDFAGVIIEPVEDNQVRAKAGTTRVFLQMTPDVTEFYRQLGKHFLHFSHPNIVRDQKIILEKIDPGKEGDNNFARLYRRGVFVREINSYNGYPSIFDYNIDIPLNESRDFDDSRASDAVAEAIGQYATTDQMFRIVKDSFDNNNRFEHGLDSYDLRRKMNDNVTNIKNAFSAVAGHNGVIYGSTILTDIIVGKGYVPILIPHNSIYNMAAAIDGLRTDRTILSEQDRLGYKFYPTTESVEITIDYIWGKMNRAELTGTKHKPKSECFTKSTTGGKDVLGFWVEGGYTVYINNDIAGGMSDLLSETVIEEVCHYISEGTDYSRDFQNLLVKAIRVFMK